MEPKTKYKSYPYYSYKSSNISLKGKNKPGPITNSDILEDSTTYCTTEDVDDMYNDILRPNLVEKMHFKILNEGQWKHLYDIYSGKAIIRKRYRKRLNSDLVPELYFLKINPIILPKPDNFELKKIYNSLPIYASKRWTFAELKERILKIYNGPNMLKYDLCYISLYKQLQNPTTHGVGGGRVHFSNRPFTKC